jgi:hypothetical protein
MNPFSIGPITIGASPVALASLAAGQPTLLRKLTITNFGTGNMFLGSSTMNISTLSGVVAIIPAGQSITIGADLMIDRIAWSAYSVHGSHQTDICLITGETVS